jgi:hypothetical protein
MRPQFTYINQLTQYQNLDTLNYSQVSQNANLNVNYILSTSKKISQNLNVNLSFQDAYDQQGGTVAEGNSSLFYNVSAAYNLLFVPQNISLTTALNGTENTIGRNNYTTLGPTLGINSRWLRKKLVAGFTTSWNVSNGVGAPASDVTSIRWNFSYAIMKKQNIGLNVVQQYTTVSGQKGTNSLVATMGYNYIF